MKKYFLTSILIFIFSFSIANARVPATLSLSYDLDHLQTEGQAVISLYLSPNDENINALAGDIIVNSGTGTISQIQDGNSIISAWVERPRIVNNKIHFAGIIPGGFNGLYSPFEKEKQPGLVIQFVVRTETPGDVSVSFVDEEAFSGPGNKATLQIDPPILVVPFTKASDSQTLNLSSDKAPPSDLTMEVMRLDNGTNGWFAIFSARDNASGIDHFEYQESLQAQPSPTNWERAETPQRLKDQSRHQYVFVKAVDRDGNSAVIAVAPQPQGLADWVYGLAALILIGLVSIFSLMRRRRI